MPVLGLATMDIPLNLESAENGHAALANARRTGRPSWPDLLRRLIAARRASVSLARDFLPDFPAGRGSFDGTAAARMGDYGSGRQIVNPNDLGNRKPGRITTGIAGRKSSGGRG
jgi:hypothetical protein